MYFRVSPLSLWPLVHQTLPQAPRRALHHRTPHILRNDNPRPFKILFLGRDEFSCLVLKELFGARDVWESIGIVTYPDRMVGRHGTVLSVSPLKILAQSLDLSIHTIPLAKSEFQFWKPPLPFAPSQSSDKEIISPPPHHLLISASFGRILPSSFLRLFAPGRCLNVHPSLLPSYRGAAPIQHAIIRGEKETGVCVIEMLERKKGIDSGGVFGSDSVSVPKNAMFVSLRDILAERGGTLLVSVLRDILAGRAQITPQEPTLSAPLAPPITADDSIIDFTTMSAEDVVRRYRAISHQRPLITYISTSKALQLHFPSVFPSSAPSPSMVGFATYHAPSRALLVRCADDSVLCVPKVKQESRALMDSKEWWNGVKSMGLVECGMLRFYKR